MASARTTRSQNVVSTKNAFTPARASRTRTRSTDNVLLASSSSPVKSRISSKRKKKFDSDSEGERPDAVIYVHKPAAHLKSSALTPPLIRPKSASSSDHIIYSSQSEEMDLVIPIQLPSPPNTESALPVPVTPLASEKAYDAIQLIENIKAKAFAETFLSDEEKQYTFYELDESSDDDALLPDDKGKSSLLAIQNSVDDLFGSPLSSVPSSTHKRNLRNHKRSPSASPKRTAVATHRTSQTQKHTRSGRTSKPTPSSRLPTVLVTPVPAKHKKSANPLEALLREKKAAEKRGNGTAAFTRAEAALQDHVSMDMDLHLADENAAWRAIQERAQRKSISPVHGQLEDDISLGERGTHILGQEAGAKIERILVSDKNTKSKKSVKEQTFGIPFWQVDAGDDGLDVNEDHAVSFGDGSNNPILALLQHLSGIRASDQLALILSSGVVCALGSEEKSAMIYPLFALAIKPTECHLSDAATSVLHSLWSTVSCISKSPLHFTHIVTALLILGARRQVAEDLDWIIRENEHPFHVTTEIRLGAVNRLVKLVEIAGRTENLMVNDTPDILLSLVLIGLDSTTSNELRANLNSAIDSICRGMDTKTHSSIHRRLVNYAFPLTPANKAHFVSFFNSGSDRTRHVGQWLAYAFFLPGSTPSGVLPPLGPLILRISPSAGSNTLFDVKSASANFEDLGHYFAILSVALANIEPYIQEESTLARSLSQQSFTMDDSPRKSQKPVVPLDLLLRVLEVMQGRIVDTRAAHLDRSRTKAEMHRLQMRIHYQRQALRGGMTATATIQDYFGPKNT